MYFGGGVAPTSVIASAAKQSKLPQLERRWLASSQVLLAMAGIVGTFHKVSAKYLPLYVAEFQFRYNNRNSPDMFETTIARVLRRGHGHPSQLETTDVSEPEPQQLEFFELWAHRHRP